MTAPHEVTSDLNELERALDEMPSAASLGLGHLRIHIDCGRNNIDINKLSWIIDVISAKRIPILSVDLVNLSAGQKIEIAKYSEEIATRPGNKTQNSSDTRLYFGIERSEADAILERLRDLAEMAPQEVSGEDLTAAAQGAESVPPDLIVFIGQGRHLQTANVWSGAYAEFSFFERDFNAFELKDLAAAVAGFGKRERRFGGVS